MKGPTRKQARDYCIGCQDVETGDDDNANHREGPLLSTSRTLLQYATNRLVRGSYYPLKARTH